MMRVGKRRQIFPCLSSILLRSEHSSIATDIDIATCHQTSQLVCLRFGFLIGLHSHLVHFDLVVDVVLRIVPLRLLVLARLLVLLFGCEDLLQLLLLLLGHSRVLHSLEKFLRIHVPAELTVNQILLMGGLGSTVFGDDCNSATIRVVHIADVVIDLQIERRLVNLDLV